MKSLFTISKSPRHHVFLDEYQSYRPVHGYLYQPGCGRDEAALSVVFVGETQRRFSSVRIVLYCDASLAMRQDRGVSAIQQLESGVVTNSSSRDNVHPAPQNDPTLPQLTIAFKVSHRRDSFFQSHIISPSLDDKLCHRNSKSVYILLESKHSIGPDTLSVTVAFWHTHSVVSSSDFLDTICYHTPNGNARARIIRVVPVDGARPRITINCLPTEILMKIFECCDSCAWQHELLSLAQVCRRWSGCAMKLLFARLESSEWKNCCQTNLEQYLDPCAFAKAFSKTPALGLGVQHLNVDQHKGWWACRIHWNWYGRRKRIRFVQALIVILRATKNLQRLHLSLGYWFEANALFSALPEIPHLHTLSITLTFCDPHSPKAQAYSGYSISTGQLVHCLSRWPSLTSLTVEGLRPGNTSLMSRFFLRPACALKQLHIRQSYVSDKDLLYLTASSAKTLAQVTLDGVWSFTDDGLRIFLDAIAQNVTSLTIWDPGNFSPGKKVPALDAVVDKMRCLETLKIRGDIASERMLHRRSEMFMRSCGSGVPVVRLSFQDAPRIWDCTDHEWAGWEVVEVR